MASSSRETPNVASIVKPHRSAAAYSAAAATAHRSADGSWPSASAATASTRPEHRLGSSDTAALTGRHRDETPVGVEHTGRVPRECSDQGASHPRQERFRAHGLGHGGRCQTCSRRGLSIQARVDADAWFKCTPNSKIPRSSGSSQRLSNVCVSSHMLIIRLNIERIASPDDGFLVCESQLAIGAQCSIALSMSVSHTSYSA